MKQTIEETSVKGQSESSTFPGGRQPFRPRPKLLFLAWYFPPVQAIASVRTWNIAKHLSRLGWDITVVTPNPSLHRHLESRVQADASMADEGIGKILTHHRRRYLDPYQMVCRNSGLHWFAGGICRNLASRLGVDTGSGWVRSAERACARLSGEQVDLILASGPPFASFVLAERLSKKLGRPYALDYRDPWTDVPGVSPILQSRIVRLERRILQGAAAVTTVSPSKALELDARFGVGPRLQVVTNGYDSEDLAKIVPHEFGHSAIVYAGHVWPPERVMTPVLSALKQVTSRDPAASWRFHYYGEHNAYVGEEAARAGIADRVTLHGRVPRRQVLSAIRGAKLAVVVTSVLDDESRATQGIVPGKLFEIAGLGCPILSIAPRGSDVESMVDSADLGRTFEGRDVDGIAAYIQQAASSQGASRAAGDRFEWTQIGRTLDRHLRDKVIHPGRERAR